MDRSLLAISTYRKNEALESTLNQCLRGDLGKMTGVMIFDAYDGHAESVYEEYKKKDLPFELHYRTEKDSPIWNSKNASIEFFLEKTSAQYLILADDDNLYKRYLYPMGRETILEALEEAHIKTKFPHIMTYLDNLETPFLTPWFFGSDFPVKYETPWTVTCTGTQGIFMFFTRLAVESVGYFKKFPSVYGAEHCDYSTRINVKLGYDPEYFVFLKNCHRYIDCQGIPNNYTVKKEEVEKNQRFYEKQREEKTRRGLDLEVLRRPLR